MKSTARKSGGALLVGLVWMAANGLAPCTAVAQTPRPTLQFIIPQLQRTPVPRPTRPTGKMSTGETSFWWNEPEMIEALELTPTQRQQMDQAMAGINQRVSDLQHKQNEARERFDTAFKARDMDAARKAAGDWETAFAQSWGILNRAKLDADAHLTPEQHAKLVKDYESLVTRPWNAMRRMHYESGAAAGGSQTPVPIGVTPAP